jgi:hypothetical protein
VVKAAAGQLAQGKHHPGQQLAKPIFNRGGKDIA